MVLKKIFVIDPSTNGRGPALSSWSNDGTLLAIVGQHRRLVLVDRTGRTIVAQQLPVDSPALSVSWSSSDSQIAVLQKDSTSVFVYNPSLKKADTVESGLKDLCWVKWSRTGETLVLANAKGAVVLYNSETSKKTNLVGKHSKRIIDGAFSTANLVALTSADCNVTISDMDGKTVDSCVVRGECDLVRFAHRKADDRPAVAGASGSPNANDRTERTLSMVMHAKDEKEGKVKTTLLLHHVRANEALTELAFNTKYGNIVAYEWYGDGYVVVGFSSGQVAVVSSHAKEIGMEVSTFKACKEQLNGLTTNANAKRGAVVGDNFVRLFELDDLIVSEAKSEKYDFDSEFGALTDVSFTQDGQLLAVTSKNGSVYVFVTRIPVVATGNGNLVMSLTSLREMTVRDCANPDVEVARVPIETEPQHIALGNGTAAVAWNAQAVYYSFEQKDRKRVTAKVVLQKTYPGIIESVRLSNNYAAVLFDGKVMLHPLDESKVPRPARTFPERADSGRVTCHALTDNFFMCGTSTGLFILFSLMDAQTITEYKHSCSIKTIVPNQSGTRVAWLDSTNAGFVFNPVSEIITPVEGLLAGTETFLWDVADPAVLVGVDGRQFTTYVYCPVSRFGPTCAAFKRKDKTLSTPRPFGHKPLVVLKATVYCQSSTGQFAPILLLSHTPEKAQADQFRAAVQLNRLSDALAVASTPEQRKEVAERALHLIDVDFAIRVFRQLNQPVLVMQLERIRHVQERNLLLGHIAMYFKNFTEAQNFFRASSCPLLALEMRRDLLHWDQALQLAEKHAPEQIPSLAREYAQQLEFRLEYAQAYEMYQRGLLPVPDAKEDDAAAKGELQLVLQHNEQCRGGAARCLMRMGNVRGGLQQLTMGVQSKEILAQCANIAQSMRQFEDAARLFERAEHYDQAAQLYVHECKMLKAAQALLPKVTSRTVLVEYAKAKEAEAAYKEAAAAYDQAEDWDNSVRVRVEHLNDLPGAYRIVRQTRSTEAASLVANVCRRRGDFAVAVEFLLVARHVQDAFTIAKAHDAMSSFEQALLGQVQLRDGVAPPDRQNDFRLVAEYYEEAGKYAIAGEYFVVAGDYERALGMFIKADSEESIIKAIEVVGRARNERFTHRLLDFLTGGDDPTQAKDPSYMFKLYMALKSFEKAAKTALIIANRDQELGNYRPAHKMLVDTCLMMQERGIRLPAELRRALMLLHSYVIVRHLIKMDDQVNAARMLLRVARNITRFPKHVAAILTSCIVQCLKVDFKASAYQYAAQLIQSDALRAEIPEKNRKKVEAVVRRRGKEELVDPAEPTSLCPFCQGPVEETALECPGCKNALPFCIVTGKHMCVEDWTQCPSCRFPALHSAFSRLLQLEPQCPLCQARVDPYSIEKTVPTDVKKFA